MTWEGKSSSTPNTFTKSERIVPEKKIRQLLPGKKKMLGREYNKQCILNSGVTFFNNYYSEATSGKKLKQLQTLHWKSNCKAKISQNCFCQSQKRNKTHKSSHFNLCTKRIFLLIMLVPFPHFRAIYLNKLFLPSFYLYSLSLNPQNIFNDIQRPTFS